VNDYWSIEVSLFLRRRWLDATVYVVRRLKEKVCWRERQLKS
jgi:hypothetical protein